MQPLGSIEPIGVLWFVCVQSVSRWRLFIGQSSSTRTAPYGFVWATRWREYCCTSCWCHNKCKTDRFVRSKGRGWQTLPGTRSSRLTVRGCDKNEVRPVTAVMECSRVYFFTATNTPVSEGNSKSFAGTLEKLRPLRDKKLIFGILALIRRLKPNKCTTNRCLLPGGKITVMSADLWSVGRNRGRSS